MKVLIVRVGAMGDVLHALPAVAALRAARPAWTIDWVVDTRWEALLVDPEGRGPVVNRVHVAETKMWSKSPSSLATIRSVLGLRRALKKERYDLVVDMQGTLRSGVIGRMAGARKFMGYADPRERLAARLYSRRVIRRGIHVVDQGAVLLGDASGIRLEPAVVTLPRTEWAENWAEEEAVVSRPLCVLGAGGGWGAKQWPAMKYGALAVRLREMGFDVVVNAPRKDDAGALAVVAASGGAARMVVCNVAGLVALMRRADLFIGGDSGPTHLAAALAVPLVALFGPTTPARNGPWGPGAHRILRHASSLTSYKRVEEIDRGLARIEVEEVVDEVGVLVSGEGTYSAQSSEL
jgi:heptosyltransferase-1